MSVPDTWTIEKGDGTLARAEKPATGRVAYTCGRHGKRLETVDPESIEIVINGVTWAFDGSAPFADGDGVGLHTCRECIDEALRTPDRRDADDLTLLTEAIADEWTNGYRPGTLDPRLFEVVDVDTDAAEVRFCPLCSDGLERVAAGYECSVHGVLAVELATVEEVPA